MDAGDRSYFLSVLQSYKDHVKDGINRFQEKHSFVDMGGVTKLNATPTELKMIEQIEGLSLGLHYTIQRMQDYLIDQERTYFNKR